MRTVYGERAGQVELWSQGQMLGLLAAAAFGVIALVSGWYGASGQATLREELPFVGLAMAGTIVVLAGVGLWFLQGRRAVGERRRFWAEVMVELHQARPGPRAATVPRRGPVRVERGLVGGPGRAYYHRARCPLAKDRGWPAESLARQLQAGRRPCAICRPPER